MTSEQIDDAVTEMRLRCRLGSRVFVDADFAGWGAARVADARQIVGDFIAAERDAGNGWRVEEIEPRRRKDGKPRKGERREWRVSVDWACKGA